LAVVATAVGQCDEVLRGGTVGMLVRPRSDEELSSALIALLRDAGLRGRLGAAFRERVADSFDATKIAAQMDGIYQVTLAAHRERGRGTKLALRTGTDPGTERP